MRTLIVLFLLLCCVFSAHAAEQKQNDLGGMEPAQALEYMKETKNLVIVDVATRRWFATKHFAGAVNIPIENISRSEALELYRGLPPGRPVLLHCRLGMIVPGAYQTLKELRPDIPEVGYITGKPLFDEYNHWYETTQQ
ncbi:MULTISPECIES: rhodanese-like domain-containing protein [unclassified Desulfovibrio]|uniref:rhodanese-like domain-containing protein n=1 Tax=unclassified Desulfovibrio TaxID=2593640 RepID=UPI000F5D74FF|nr:MULTISPECIES: rhodanese-like domain-containing protein [unclassified Desulfovibrio]RRD69254.1 rhodanese-like domain-containing protein [Desulfovibrio sp. OH1209_COT-279]RRD85720.1 rhodanese-like domain-containing protein [Desulfovibrio sp. OH1186_COT-070]